jgi:penicillin-binding protein 1A
MAISGKGKTLVADRRYPASGKRTASKAPAPPRKSGPRPRRKPRSFLARVLLGLWAILWGIGWRVTGIGVMVLACAILFFLVQLPPVGDILDGRARGSVTMLDREGQTFAWRGETFDGQMTAKTVSLNLKNAIVATEDKRFYQHFGISPRGIVSAIRINLLAGRGPLEGNGGSTITQQVAKLLCLGVEYDPKAWTDEKAYEDDCRGGGLWRKVKEIPYSMAMELKYSKEDILTIYLNRAYLGAGARGFEAAAQRYFGKSAAKVTPAEAAMLAGLLKAPSKYAPTNNLKRAQDRAAVIIGLMSDQGYITPEEAEAALARPAELSQAAARNSGGAFADWVMESTPSYLGSETTEDVIMETTLDQRLQRAAEDGLAYVFETKLKAGSKAQAAIVVMSADGAVRAMVGGRQIAQAGSFNRATQALRQTGSSFKPFVYAAALDQGWSPMDYVDDSPLAIQIPGSGTWRPENYDKEFKGLIPIAQAMAESRNVPAVKISEAVGREAVRRIAGDFGIRSDLAAGPALALGASEATLLEMTGAYAGILNGGSSVTPYGLTGLRLKDQDDPIIGPGGGIGERVISEEAARLLTWMMTRVVEEGTGQRARLEGHQVAGKTGTTSEARDAWFIGFTADYVTGVWMGYDDNTPLTGVTGGGLPAEIWHEVMQRVEEGMPSTPLPLIVPEPRQRPDLPQAQDGGQGSPARTRQADPIGTLLLRLLGGGN